MKCGDCKYFEAHNRLKEAPDAKINDCRRRAPSGAGWPKVRLSDWCGSYKAKPLPIGYIRTDTIPRERPDVLRGARALAFAAILIMSAGAAIAEGGPDSVYIPGVGYVDSARHAPMQIAEKRRKGRAVDPAIHSLVTRKAQAAGVPVNVAHAVIRQESGYRPRVRGAAGEYGLGQIKCATARGEGFSGNCSALFDPATNLKYSMRYLRKALDRGGVQYYNAGIHAKRVPVAAQRYAAAVMGRAR